MFEDAAAAASRIGATMAHEELKRLGPMLPPKERRSGRRWSWWRWIDDRWSKGLGSKRPAFMVGPSITKRTHDAAATKPRVASPESTGS